MYLNRFETTVYLCVSAIVFNISSQVFVIPAFSSIFCKILQTVVIELSISPSLPSSKSSESPSSCCCVVMSSCSVLVAEESAAIYNPNR